MKPTAMANARAIIIGSGFGGLSAAVRLAARGYRVTVLEKLDAPGGRAYVVRQDGFTFDSGPTIITAPSMLRELWQLGGRNFDDEIDLRHIEPYYRIRFDDGTHFDYNGDTEAMIAEVARISPDDVEGYKRYLEASERVYAIGFEQLMGEPFHSVLKMVKHLPELIKVQFYRSVYSLVSSYVKHPKLRIVFSFHPLLVGGNPFSTTAVYTLISHLERSEGVHFPLGGTGKLVEGMVSLIESLGGTIRYNCQVEEILVQQRRATGVRLAGGEQLQADVIVSNADSASTYGKLIAPEYRRRWTDRKLDRARYSMSLFVWYFGTRRQYPDVPHHMILLGPRYKELLRDIFDSKKVADDFSLYLHRPTATDPSLAPAGCDAFYVLSPVPHLDSGTEWKTCASDYKDRLAQALSDTVLPDLEQQVVTSRLLTPLDFRDRLGSYKGAAFGLEPVLTQTAWFRPHNKSEELDRLYLVGAGTHPGAGVPGVIASARVLDRIVPDPADL